MYPHWIGWIGFITTTESYKYQVVRAIMVFPFMSKCIPTYNSAQVWRVIIDILLNAHLTKNGYFFSWMRLLKNLFVSLHGRRLAEF